jgi:hypothetical protein
VTAFYTGDVDELFSRIARDAETLTVASGDSFLLSYREFVLYFDEARPITRHHLIIGASCVYSWMPTILDFRSEEFAAGVAILERARVEGHVSNCELGVLKHLINNSVGGASKLLHIVAPRSFAIWDSRVKSYLGPELTKRAGDDIEECQQYWSMFRRLAATDEAGTLATAVGQLLGYPVTAMRALELVMFSSARGAARGLKV